MHVFPFSAIKWILKVLSSFLLIRMQKRKQASTAMVTKRSKPNTTEGKSIIRKTEIHVPRPVHRTTIVRVIPSPNTTERKSTPDEKKNQASSESSLSLSDTHKHMQNKTEARSYILKTQYHVPSRASSSRSFLDTRNHKHMQKKIDSLSSVGQSSKCFCGICFDFKTEADMFRRSKCNHPFCADCISKHVATQIQQNILKVNCPHPNCSIQLKPEYLQAILPKQVIDRWECARVESSIASRQKIYCPFKSCSVLLVNDGADVVTSSECPSCHRLFCAQCKVPWHAGMNCKEFKRSKSEKKLESEFLELAKSKMWQKCPKCSIYVQRSSGCEHMKCRCGCNFCYNCGKNWKYGHTCKKP